MAATKSKTPNEYEAIVSRGERYWIVCVPAIDRYTQARHLRELRDMTVDLIEVMTGERPRDVTFTYDLPRVNAHLAAAAALRIKAAEANSGAAAEARAAARELHDHGVPLRDIGEVLGISYQRAHQLLSEAS